MQSAIEAFRASIQRVRDMHVLHASITSTVTPIVDLSDLLRAEIVLLVSALDYYIHELTRLGLLEIWNGKRASTKAYLKFSVSLDCATHLATTSGAIRLDNEIRSLHSLLAFQQPDKIADAVRLFSPVELWPTIASAMSTDAGSLKKQLQLIVSRRNKIAHEADIDPSYPGQRWPIARTDVEEALALVEAICEGIHTAAA